MNISINKVLIMGWCTIMSVICCFLIAEYQFFKTQAHQLELIKDDYAHYVSKLKHKVQNSTEIVQNNSLPATENSAELKQQLLLVNRALTYLKSAKPARKLDKKVHALSALDVHKDAKKLAFKKKMHPKAQVKGITKRKRLASMKGHWRKMPHDARFIWPLDRSSFWLSSPYGPRKNPDGWGFHYGIDLAASKGTLVKAVDNGIVLVANSANGYGNNIVIEHDDKFKTRYAHLDKILVRPGQKVKKGDFIGKVGATGTVRRSRRGGKGEHLHFEVMVFGKHVNPHHYLA